MLRRSSTEPSLISADGTPHFQVHMRPLHQASSMRSIIGPDSVSVGESQSNSNRKQSTHKPDDAMKGAVPQPGRDAAARSPRHCLSPADHDIFEQKAAQAEQNKGKRQIYRPATAEQTKFLGSSRRPVQIVQTEAESQRRDASLKMFNTKQRIERRDNLSAASCVPDTDTGGEYMTSSAPRSLASRTLHRSVSGYMPETSRLVARGARTPQTSQIRIKDTIEGPLPLQPTTTRLGRQHKPSDPPSPIQGVGGVDPSAFTQKRRVGQCTPKDSLGGAGSTVQRAQVV